MVGLFPAVNIFPVLNTKNQNIPVQDHEDDAVVPDPKFAQAGERAGVGGEAFWIVTKGAISISLRGVSQFETTL